MREKFEFLLTKREKDLIVANCGDRMSRFNPRFIPVHTGRQFINLPSASRGTANSILSLRIARFDRCANLTSSRGEEKRSVSGVSDRLDRLAAGTRA